MSFKHFSLVDQGRIRLFWFLFSLLVSLLAVYIYFVNSLIFDVVRRQQNLDTLSQLQAEVIVLESEHLSRTSQITLELAKQLGYQDATSKMVFAAGQGEPVTVGLRPSYLNE